MNIILTGRGIDITDALRQYTIEKFTRLNRHFDHIIDANVRFHIEKLIQKAEATIHVPGEDIFASSESSDLYSAIDLLIDKLDTQVKKYKEKIRKHHE